jgi:hypothetical protein
MCKPEIGGVLARNPCHKAMVGFFDHTPERADAGRVPAGCLGDHRGRSTAGNLASHCLTSVALLWRIASKVARLT